MYLLLAGLLICGCNPTNLFFTEPIYVSTENVEHETLIKLYMPITTGGYVFFLSNKDNKCEYWEFSFGADPKNKDAYCKLENKEIYDIGDARIPFHKWETAKGLEQNFKRKINSYKGFGNNFRKRYKEEEQSLNCLAGNFLQLSNDERLETLKKLSSLNEWTPFRLSDEKIRWKRKKLLEDIWIEDTCQIIDWGNRQLPWAVSYSNDIVVNGEKIFILVVNGFSGLIRSGIYIFKEDSNKWNLVAEGKKIAFGTIQTENDLKNQKIVFYESTDKNNLSQEIRIGELSYDNL